MYRRTDGNDEQMLRYSSPRNISFRGTISTGITKAEWADMSDDEQDSIIDEILYELVDIGPIGPTE